MFTYYGECFATEIERYDLDKRSGKVWKGSAGNCHVIIASLQCKPRNNG